MLLQTLLLFSFGRGVAVFLMSHHLRNQLDDGYDMIDGNVIRIKVTNDEGGRLGEAIVQVTDTT